MTTPERDLADENRALKAQLQDKLKQLIQRERDVHTLMRRLHETYRWMGSIADLASRIAAASDRRASLAILAETLVVDLDYDLAVASWGTLTVEIPPLEDELARARLAEFAVVPAPPIVARATWPDGVALVDAWRIHIPSLQAADDDTVTLVVGRGARTARYRHVDEDAIRQRLERLAAVLTHAFDTVRLKLDLIAERDQLQDRVAAATAELRAALEIAEDARRDAEHAARVRTEFLANMSHEIRTPMTAVLGYADLLMGEGVSRDRQMHWLETIRKSGGHLLQILDDILDLARLESGRFRLDTAPASLGSVLHDVQSLLNVRAADKGLELVLEFATPLPRRALFDAARMRQVLINLVGNAIKFTGRGRVAIVASYARVDGEDILRVLVDDTGIGVSPEKVAMIFEDFEQESTGTARAHGGTGLGLAISRRLARLMGGDIQLVPKVGPGSSFVATIRAEVIAASGWDMSASPIEERGQRPATGAEVRGRVLLVEDTPLIQRVMQLVLADAGLEVRVAGLGTEALELLTKTPGCPWDVVLMDMQMPGLDGYETTRRVRAAGIDLPIIALTAHAMAGDRELCIACGCDDYLAKPVERTVLIETVRRFLDGRGREAAPARER